MAYGIRVRDAAGNITMDTNYQAGRIIGVVEVNGNGSMVVPGLAQGIPFWVVVPLIAGGSNRYPRVSVAGTTMSWSYSNSGNYPNGSCRIFYGVR